MKRPQKSLIVLLGFVSISILVIWGGFYTRQRNKQTSVVSLATDTTISNNDNQRNGNEAENLKISNDILTYKIGNEIVFQSDLQPFYTKILGEPTWADDLKQYIDCTDVLYANKVKIYLLNKTCKGGGGQILLITKDNAMLGDNISYPIFSPKKDSIAYINIDSISNEHVTDCISGIGADEYFHLSEVDNLNFITGKKHILLSDSNKNFSVVSFSTDGQKLLIKEGLGDGGSDCYKDNLIFGIYYINSGVYVQNQGSVKKSELNMICEENKFDCSSI